MTRFWVGKVVLPLIDCDCVVSRDAEADAATVLLILGALMTGEALLSPPVDTVDLRQAAAGCGGDLLILEALYLLVRGDELGAIFKSFGRVLVFECRSRQTHLSSLHEQHIFFIALILSSS
jgi:hypothetical protein